jgi:hypothetical protein
VEINQTDMKLAYIFGHAATAGAPAFSGLTRAAIAFEIRA